MTTRKVKFKEAADVTPCPECGNKTDFTIHSARGGEDFCDVWAECKCGHEPDPIHAFEDVWGGCHDENVMAAISCWNDAMLAHAG